MKIVDYLYIFIYKIFYLLVKFTPKHLMNIILKGMAFFAYNWSDRHKHIIDQNLDITFPNMKKQEKIRIGKHAYFNLLKNISGFIEREDEQKDKILENITFVNDQGFQQAINDNRKIIMVTAHYGNWELIATALTIKFNIKMSAVGREMDSKPMQNILKKSREKFDIELINKKGALKGLIRALNQNRILGLLVDQNISEKKGGIEISFFNHKATQTPSPAILARKFNALIIPAFITTHDYKNYTITFDKVIEPIISEDSQKDIRLMTQLQADAIQRAIEAKPDEWFWMHKRWKTFYPDIYRFKLTEKVINK